MIGPCIGVPFTYSAGPDTKLCRGVSRSRSIVKLRSRVQELGHLKNLQPGCPHPSLMRIGENGDCSGVLSCIPNIANIPLSGGGVQLNHGLNTKRCNVSTRTVTWKLTWLSS